MVPNMAPFFRKRWNVVTFFLNHTVVSYIIFFEMPLTFNLNGAKLGFILDQKNGCIFFNHIVVDYIIFFWNGFVSNFEMKWCQMWLHSRPKRISKKWNVTTLFIKTIVVGYITFCELHFQHDESWSRLETSTKRKWKLWNSWIQIIKNHTIEI